MAQADQRIVQVRLGVISDTQPGPLTHLPRRVMLYIFVSKRVTVEDITSLDGNTLTHQVITMFCHCPISHTGATVRPQEMTKRDQEA